MDMDSEHESVGHVDGDDEADNLCEIEDCLELIQPETVTATTYYEKDVDIEELLCDTPEPTNPESTTEASAPAVNLNLDSKEKLNNLISIENKELAKISEREPEQLITSKKTLDEQILEMETNLKERTWIELKMILKF